MTNVLEDARILDNPLETTPRVPPPRANPISGAGPICLVFAPAPPVLGDRPVIAVVRVVKMDLPAPRVRPLRRFRTDWYEAAIITLIPS